MLDRKLIIIAVLVAALVFTNFRSCDRSIRVDREVVIDTVQVSDTVLINRVRRDTIKSVLVDSVPVVYWDTVYRDTVYRYVQNIEDSLVSIENVIVAGGRVYESNIQYLVTVPERVITNTVTINRTEKVLEYRKGLYLGTTIGYPLNISGVAGWQFKSGSMLLAQKSFLSPEKFELCLITPVFKR